jgi:hypothetical protein
MRTHYDILGVAREADHGEIKRAWRVRLQLLHPDRHEGAPADVRAEAARETALINDAWAILGDEERRRQYDRHLSDDRADTARRTTPEPARQPDASEPPLFVCLRCRANLEFSVDSMRCVCRKCFAAWRIVMCDGCGRNVLVDERWTTWRCISCDAEYPSHWGGTVEHECTECAWRNEVARTSEEFVCAKCDLVYLRCACGEYTACRSRRRKKWRCAHCDLDNTRVRA